MSYAIESLSPIIKECVCMSSQIFYVSLLQLLALESKTKLFEFTFSIAFIGYLAYNPKRKECNKVSGSQNLRVSVTWVAHCCHA